MKPYLNFKTAIFSFVVLLFIAASCKKEEVTYSLELTFAHSKVVDGKIGYAKLVKQNDSISATALYAMDATFKNGKAIVVQDSIKAGDYTVYAFIDMNGNASDSTGSMPDVGDYTTTGIPLVVTDIDRELYLREDYWVKVKN